MNIMGRKDNGSTGQTFDGGMMTKKTKIILVITTFCIVGSFGLSFYISSLQYTSQDRLGRAVVRQQIQELIETNPFPDHYQLDGIASPKGEPNFKDCFVTSGILSFYQLLATILTVVFLIFLMGVLFREKITRSPADITTGDGKQGP